jgi:hypothetical protein
MQELARKWAAGAQASREIGRSFAIRNKFKYFTTLPDIDGKMNVPFAFESSPIKVHFVGSSGELAVPRLAHRTKEG